VIFYIVDNISYSECGDA